MYTWGVERDKAHFPSHHFVLALKESSKMVAISVIWDNVPHPFQMLAMWPVWTQRNDLPWPTCNFCAKNQQSPVPWLLPTAAELCRQGIPPRVVYKFGCVPQAQGTNPVKGALAAGKGVRTRIKAESCRVCKVTGRQSCSLTSRTQAANKTSLLFIFLYLNPIQVQRKEFGFTIKQQQFVYPLLTWFFYHTAVLSHVTSPIVHFARGL